jgi:hypothetical protein
MLNASVRQFSWDELRRPFSGNENVSSAEFEKRMAPTNSDIVMNTVPLVAQRMSDPAPISQHE